MTTKMSDMLVTPIADFSETLANILHAADIATFQMQSAEQFKSFGLPEQHERWKAKAQTSLHRLKTTVAALENEIESI